MSHSNELLRDIYKYNLCSFYLLPFCNVNTKLFGEDNANFVNCWVHPNGSELYVLVNSLEHCEPDVFECKYHLGCSDTNKRLLYYRMPYPWRPEFPKFKKGKYSEFSDRAKRHLRDRSGLGYLRPRNTGGFQTDARLLALDRDSTLRELLVTELQLEPISEESELLRPPLEVEYMVP